MPELSKDVVALLYFLLPGFIVGWVFYGLTSLQKPAQIERIIQALIFTLFVKGAVSATKIFLEFTGHWVRIEPKAADFDLIASITFALLLGYIGSYLVNTDKIHKIFRSAGVSNRSAHPSEWCNTFSTFPRYVVLNLKDERRLYGWPEIWPSDPTKGHLFISNPSWLTDDGSVEMPTTEGILVDVEDIKFVELMKEPEQT